MQTTASISSSKNLQQLMRQYPLVSFFSLAYAISWIISIPYILSQWNILPNVQQYQIFFIIKSFGPAIAAYIMARVIDGPEGLQRLKSRIRLWRVGWQWYALILLAVPALMLLGIIVLPGAMSSFTGIPANFVISYAISFIIIALGGGPLGEEPGWRGFALPQLQSRYSVWKANLILGLMWTFWHLPDFLTVAQKGGPGSDPLVLFYGLVVFLLEVMALTIVFTWVFNNTGGSVFIAIVLHASYNAFGMNVQPLFPAPIVTRTDLPFVIGVVVPALLILFLTRRRLGFQPDPRS